VSSALQAMSLMKLQRSVVCAALVFGSVLAGCSSLRRARECKRVIDTVNGSLSQLAADPDAGASPATYVRLADAYDALGKQLEGANSQDPGLSRVFGSYRELIRRAAQQSRLFAEELDKPSSTPEEEAEKETRLTQLRTRAKGELSREASLVRKLNGLCHP
jgi:outer membrane murein-binding lipoprotein Lpp